MSNWRNDLLGADRISFDIEISDPETLLCCGFAARPDKAYVFPADRRAEIVELLTSDVPKVAQNAQFDVHWLFTRWGVAVNNLSDDTMLAWHAMYPSLAGKSDQKSYRMTRKGLSFLASLYTREPYWKFYDTDEAGMYELNGRDCCVTLEIMEKLDSEIDQLGVRDIYEHNLSLVWPAVKMQARGLVVDEAERRSRLKALRARYDELAAEINERILPVLEDRRERLDGDWHLFQRGGFETDNGYRETCPCCNGGKKKSQSCTSCAGIEGTGASGSVLKSDLLSGLRSMERQLSENGLEDLTKAELEELVPPCKVCGGDGKRVKTWFNPTSDTQQKKVLYEILRAPKRYNGGSLTTDETALKSLLGEI